MQQFSIGEKVRINREFPDMHEFLREHMSRGDVAEVIRHSSMGSSERVLVKFEIPDPAFGIYWIKAAVLSSAPTD